MTSADLSKVLWDLANQITAFAAVQALAFAYACAKKEIADAINRKALKVVIAAIVASIAIAQCVAVEWCRRRLCAVDPGNCDIYSDAGLGRIAFIVLLLVFSLLMLYARQIFSKKPFDK